MRIGLRRLWILGLNRCSMEVGTSAQKLDVDTVELQRFCRMGDPLVRDVDRRIWKLAFWTGYSEQERRCFGRSLFVYQSQAECALYATEFWA